MDAQTPLPGGHGGTFPGEHGHTDPTAGGDVPGAACPRHGWFSAARLERLQRRVRANALVPGGEGGRGGS